MTAAHRNTWGWWPGGIYALFPRSCSWIHRLNRSEVPSLIDVFPQSHSLRWETAFRPKCFPPCASFVFCSMETRRLWVVVYLEPKLDSPRFLEQLDLQLRCPENCDKRHMNPTRYFSERHFAPTCFLVAFFPDFLFGVLDSSPFCCRLEAGAGGEETTPLFVFSWELIWVWKWMIVWCVIESSTKPWLFAGSRFDELTYLETPSIEPLACQLAFSFVFSPQLWVSFDRPVSLINLRPFWLKFGSKYDFWSKYFVAGSQWLLFTFNNWVSLGNSVEIQE